MSSLIKNIEKIQSMANDEKNKQLALQSLLFLRSVEPHVFVMQPVQDLLNTFALTCAADTIGLENLQKMDATAIRDKMLNVHVTTVKSRMIAENCDVYYHHVGQCSKEFVTELKARLLRQDFKVEDEWSNALDSDDETYVPAREKEANVLKVSL